VENRNNEKAQNQGRFRIEKLEERIAPSGNPHDLPPGSGNWGGGPGNSGSGDQNGGNETGGGGQPK